MSYRLKQENFNKPVTAEALKVLLVIAEYRADLMAYQLPFVSAIGDVIGETPGRISYPNRHIRIGSTTRRRCAAMNCFCTLSRLQANMVIRFILRHSSHKKAMLREWRLLRQAERNRRRMGSARRAFNIIPAAQPVRGDVISTADQVTFTTAEAPLSDGAFVTSFDVVYGEETRQEDNNA